MSSVLTWAAPDTGSPVAASERLRALQASHHAMWNYVTYRDAIALVGLDPATLYPEGATRLDPAEWADLGWLTCFAGPPASALRAMRAAVSPAALGQYAPDLTAPLREAAASLLGRPRDAAFEVVGTEGAQAAIALALMAVVDPGDEVVVSDPGYFHVPSAVIAAGGRPVAVPIGPRSGFRLDPDAVASALTERTRAVCLVDPVNPYGTVQAQEEVAALAALAERHGFLLIHDVTHAPLAIDPRALVHPLPALGLSERAVAVASVSHCYGMAGARIGFLGGPPALLRACLQLKAGLTRLNGNPISQAGALAALEDRDYLPAAERVIRGNLERLRATLRRAPGVRLAAEPGRGLACALDVSESGATAQEIMVALFARRVAVYPGDGLGERFASATLRLNLSRPDAWAMERLDQALPEAVAEAASGRWREPVARMLDGKGTRRAARLARLVRAA